MTTRHLFAHVKEWMQIKTDTELASRLDVSASSIVHHQMGNLLSDHLLIQIYDNTNMMIEEIREWKEKS